MLRGNIPAKMEANGRLKIPEDFLKFLREKYDNHVFVTSIKDNSICIYPLAVWEKVEEMLGAPPITESKSWFRERTNYLGQEAEIDEHGRVLIHQHLREYTKIDGQVAVIGQFKYLEVSPYASFKERIEKQPLTHKHREELAEIGIDIY